jgi:hypothetical protein
MRKMLISETQEILRRVAAVDNRKVTAETVEAWNSIIGRIPFDIAKEALTLAQQDSTIKYLEPRHIVGWAKEAAFRLDRAKPKPAESEFQKVDQPVCRAHSLPIMSCRPCCRQMSQQDLNPPQLLLWAKQNIYA